MKPGAGAELVGYEDSRTRFLGEGSLARPTGCERWRWRKLDDEGKLWTFDPAASFTLEATLAADGAAEAEFVVGRSDNAVWASELIARRLDLPPLPEPELQKLLLRDPRGRAVARAPRRWPFAFSRRTASRSSLTHRTPRPWAHVMANELGMSTMVSNDGEIFSAFGNARQNGLPPSASTARPSCSPADRLSARSRHGETDAPGFAPFQREDAAFGVDL